MPSYLFFVLRSQLGRLHDRHLIGILAALVIWDLLYLSVWQSISPLTTESKMVGVSILTKTSIKGRVKKFIRIHTAITATKLSET